MVLWLRLHASSAAGVGSIPGQGTKIPHAMQHSQKRKKEIAFGSGPVVHPTTHLCKFLGPHQCGAHLHCYPARGQAAWPGKCLEQKGFCVVARKFPQAPEEPLKQHSIDLKDHPLFLEVEKCLNAGSAVAMIWRD